MNIATQQPQELAEINAIEAWMMTMPQTQIAIEHHLHAGVYSRTAFVEENHAVCGVEICIATQLITCGDVTAYTGNGEIRLTGYHVIDADAGRKTAFVAHSDSYITMFFSTEATTIDEAEREFTREFERLQTRVNQ